MFFFYQNDIQKDKGLDLGAEPTRRIKLLYATPLPGRQRILQKGGGLPGKN